MSKGLNLHMVKAVLVACEVPFSYHHDLFPPLRVVVQEGNALSFTLRTKSEKVTLKRLSVVSRNTVENQAMAKLIWPCI
jgi:hypothetical protein